MDNTIQTTTFHENDIDWKQLAEIGILKDELMLSGEMDTLLKGEKTQPITLELVLLGVDVIMDATLQLTRKNSSPILEIIGINTNSLN